MEFKILVANSKNRKARDLLHVPQIRGAKWWKTTLLIRCILLVGASLLLFPLHSAAGSGPTETTAGSTKKPPERTHVLTTAREAHSLTDEEAQRGLPVHLRGVVTYFDPDFGSGQPAIFIHDATGGIFIKLICKMTCTPADRLFVGALLDVRGVSAPGGFGPVVGNPEFQILGRAPLPPTRRA